MHAMLSMLGDRVSQGCVRELRNCVSAEYARTGWYGPWEFVSPAHVPFANRGTGNVWLRARGSILYMLVAGG